MSRCSSALYLRQTVTNVFPTVEDRLDDAIFLHQICAVLTFLLDILDFYKVVDIEGGANDWFNDEASKEH
jgi:hypothetical protein